MEFISRRVCILPLAQPAQQKGDWDPPVLQFSPRTQQHLPDSMMPFPKSIHATKLSESASSFLYDCFCVIRSAGILDPDDCLLRVMSRETTALIQHSLSSCDFNSFGAFIDVKGSRGAGFIRIQLVFRTSLVDGGRRGGGQQCACGWLDVGC